MLSEETLMILVRKCSDNLDENMTQALVESITATNFDSLKLWLYEKQEDYIKCLQLLIE